MALCRWAPAKTILVDSQGTNLGLERRPGHAESCRRAVGSRHTAIAFIQRGFDSRPFVRQQFIAKRRRRSSVSGGPFFEPALVDSQRLCICDDDGPFDHVLQFADVSWPRIRAKQMKRAALDLDKLLTGPLGESLREILDEEWDVR